MSVTLLLRNYQLLCVYPVHHQIGILSLSLLTMGVRLT